MTAVWKESRTCLFLRACFWFFSPSILPLVKIFHFFFPPSFLQLSVVCPIDLFVAAILMVKTFGCFINTRVVNGDPHSKTKPTNKQKPKQGRIVLIRSLLTGFYSTLRERVCGSNRLAAPPAISKPTQGADFSETHQITVSCRLSLDFLLFCH